MAVVIPVGDILRRHFSPTPYRLYGMNYPEARAFLLDDRPLAEKVRANGVVDIEDRQDGSRVLSAYGIEVARCIGSPASEVWVLGYRYRVAYEPGDDDRRQRYESIRLSVVRRLSMLTRHVLKFTCLYLPAAARTWAPLYTRIALLSGGWRLTWRSPCAGASFGYPVILRGGAADLPALTDSAVRRRISRITNVHNLRVLVSDLRSIKELEALGEVRTLLTDDFESAARERLLSLRLDGRLGVGDYETGI